MLVVDASFVVQASIAAEGLGRLSGRRAIAPPLLWSETTSVLHELRWRGVISNALADIALGNFARAAISRRQPRQLLGRAWMIASDFGWAKTYDAEYVALAELVGCPLLTLDARLAQRVAERIGIVRPADL